MPLYRAELLAKKPLWHGALIHDVSQVLYLPFDWDDGSYARDRSGYNNHGTIYGATLATGKIGMARTFDGVDDYVNLGDVLDFETGQDFTIMCWFKGVSGSHTAQGLISKGDGYYSDQWNLRDKWDAGDIVFRNNAQMLGTEGEVYWDDTWHHVAVTIDRDDMSYLYVDGVEKASVSSAVWGTFSNPVDLNIGRRSVSPEYFVGTMDEVRFYNRVLSQDEIRMLMYRRLM